MKNERYVVLATEYCNGFPHSSIEHFDTLSKAENYFDETRDNFLNSLPCDYLTYDNSEDGINYIKKFCADETKASGNGFFIGIATEDDAISAIMRKVDNCKNMTEYLYFGEKGMFTTLVPTIIFSNGKINTIDFGCEYIPYLTKIIRRAENQENLDSGGFIYDVYITLHNVENKEKLSVCYSLEDVSMDVIDVILEKLFCY